MTSGYLLVITDRVIMYLSSNHAENSQFSATPAESLHIVTTHWLPIVSLAYECLAAASSLLGPVCDSIGLIDTVPEPERLSSGALSFRVSGAATDVCDHLHLHTRAATSAAA